MSAAFWRSKTTTLSKSISIDFPNIRYSSPNAWMAGLQTFWYMIFELKVNQKKIRFYFHLNIILHSSKKFTWDLRLFTAAIISLIRFFISSFSTCKWKKLISWNFQNISLTIAAPRLVIQQVLKREKTIFLSDIDNVA